jgi:5-methylthioadenosine/S-adenosylhomocysteine deaminase
MKSILIRNGALLTSEGWLEPGYVLVEGGEIKAVGAGAPPPGMAGEETVDAAHCAVLPGLINGHTHFSQSFMRGLGGGLPLLPWLKERIWPLQRAMTPETLRLAARLALIENLRCGATTVVDHHKIARTPAHTDAVCEAAAELGLRVTLARAWADLGNGAEEPQEILADLERLLERWAGSPHVTIANGPVALWRCSPETLQRTHALIRAHGGVTHAHVAETRDEVTLSLEAHDLRPVAWLEEIGVLGPETELVHAVWLDEEELDLVAERGATVVHCPIANMVLGSGAAPVPALQAREVPVRLGSDGPASNDTQDLFEVMKAALNLARVTALDPTVLAPDAVLRMATDGRALTPGAPADLIVVNLNHPRAVPVHDLDAALVLCSHGSDVRTVIAGGKVLLRDGELLVLDESALLEECRRAVRELLRESELRTN